MIAETAHKRSGFKETLSLLLGLLLIAMAREKNVGRRKQLCLWGKFRGLWLS